MDISSLLGGGGGGGTSVAVADEGTQLTAAATNINFVGAGVVATEPATDNITVTIAGGSSSDPVFFYASMSADQNNLPDATNNILEYDTIVQTQGCNFVTGTYSVTNLPSGTYTLQSQFRVNDLNGSTRYEHRIEMSGGFYLGVSGNKPLAPLELDNHTMDITRMYRVTNGNGHGYCVLEHADTGDDVDAKSFLAFFSGSKTSD